MFGTRSNEFHAAQVRPVQKHYTMNSMKEMEPLVDKTIQLFTQRMDEAFVKNGQVCAMDDWLIYCESNSGNGLCMKLTFYTSCVGRDQ